MMNNTVRPRSLNLSLNRAWNGFVGQRGKAFGLMIFGALIAFEIFNFSTTEFALHDVLGERPVPGEPEREPEQVRPQRLAQRRVAPAAVLPALFVVHV